MDLLNEALTEYFSLTDLTMDEQTRFRSLYHRDGVLGEPVKQSAALADHVFVAALGSAGTQLPIGHDVAIDSVPPSFVKAIGKFLRYATEICDASGLEVQGCTHLTLVFRALKRMCTAGFKNPELFFALENRFQEMLNKLPQFEGYLHIARMGNTNPTILTAALVDILLFCGKVTKFMEGTSCRVSS